MHIKTFFHKMNRKGFLLSIAILIGIPEINWFSFGGAEAQIVVSEAAEVQMEDETYQNRREGVYAFREAVLREPEIWPDEMQSKETGKEAQESEKAQSVIDVKEEPVLAVLDKEGGMPAFQRQQHGQEAAAELAMEEELLTEEDMTENLTILAKTGPVLEKEYNEDMVIKLTKEDISILERIVEAEATCEDVYGKILVANVVLNRMNSKKFPNTIEKVVFQKGQFTPIQDGRYYTVKVTKETKEAVERTLSGEDYSDGALYFFARTKTTSRKAAWFDTHLIKLFQYEGHDFFIEK